MKRQFGKILQHIAALFLGVFLILGNVAQAADNTGTGDVAGDAAALADSNVFQLFGTAGLALSKTAFLTSTGAQLTSGDTLPAGTSVDFMIYVNNMGSVAVTDVSVQDVLDALFAYQTDTIRVDNSVANCAAAACTLAEEAAIYASAVAVAAGTDAIDAPDTVSFDIGTDTVDVGDESVANGQLDVAANTVMAVVFTVQVQ
jgi:uncharacterized repeat protein (TIGR01451 family)